MPAKCSTAARVGDANAVGRVSSTRLSGWTGRSQGADQRLLGPDREQGGVQPLVVSAIGQREVFPTPCCAERANRRGPRDRSSTYGRPRHGPGLCGGTSCPALPWSRTSGTPPTRGDDGTARRPRFGDSSGSSASEAEAKIRPPPAEAVWRRGRAQEVDGG
jgi:hypothetical protein